MLLACDLPTRSCPTWASDLLATDGGLIRRSLLDRTFCGGPMTAAPDIGPSSIEARQGPPGPPNCNPGDQDAKSILGAASRQFWDATPGPLGGK